MKLVFPIIIVLISLTSIFAQETTVSVETDFVGMARPIAIELPIPYYTHDPKDPGPNGRVSVAVTVDEKGKVIEADDADGPGSTCKAASDSTTLAIRGAAINAALRARFMPAFMDQKKVKAWGRIIYLFTSPIPPEPVRPTATGDKAPLKIEAGVDKAPNPGLGRGGIINGRALMLPKPVYPTRARAAHVGGPVTVQVIIDEHGNVLSAWSVSGDALLRSSAQTAACSAKFTPTLLSGQPVKVSGVITFNFTPTPPPTH